MICQVASLAELGLWQTIHLRVGRSLWQWWPAHSVAWQKFRHKARPRAAWVRSAARTSRFEGEEGEILHLSVGLFANVQAGLCAALRAV